MAKGSGEYQVKITAKDSASGELKKLNAQARRIQGEMDKLNKKSMISFQNMKKVAGVAVKSVAAVGAAAGAAATGIFLLAKSAAKHNDEMGKLSQRLGVSVEFFSQMKFAAERSGNTMKELRVGLADMNERIVNQESKFKKWGVATRDVNGRLKSTKEVLFAVSDRMASMESAAQRTALAQDLMGGSGKKLIGTLQQGSEALRALAADADRVGATITENDAKWAAAFNDSFDTMKETFNGLMKSLGTAFMPALTRVFNTITNAIVMVRNQFKFTQKDADDLIVAMFNGFKKVSLFIVDSVAAALIGIDSIIRGLKGTIDAIAVTLLNARASVQEMLGNDAESRQAQKAADMLLQKMIASERASAKFAENLGRVRGTLEQISLAPAGSGLTSVSAPEIEESSITIPAVSGSKNKKAATSHIRAAAKLSKAGDKLQKTADDTRISFLDAANASLSAAMSLKSILQSDASGGKKAAGTAKVLAMAGLELAGYGNTARILGQAGSLLGFSDGGIVPNTRYSRPGMDSVPAMLTPGERVLTVDEARSYESMRSGVTINVSSSIPPDRGDMDRIIRDNYVPAVRRLQRLGAA